jgi:hypothetical protein
MSPKQKERYFPPAEPGYKEQIQMAEQFEHEEHEIKVGSYVYASVSAQSKTMLKS